MCIQTEKKRSSKTHQITFSSCISFTELYIFLYLVLTKEEKLLTFKAVSRKRSLIGISFVVVFLSALSQKKNFASIFKCHANPCKPEQVFLFLQKSMISIQDPTKGIYLIDDILYF